MTAHPRRRSLRLGLMLAGLLLGPLAVVAAAAPATRPERDLAAAEDRLLDAEARHDVAAIAQGFADEAVFVHGNGNTQTKASYLEAAGARPGGGSITTEDRTVLVSGKIGVTRGKLMVVNGPLRLPGLYLGVYVKRDGRWQLLNWQTTPGPRAPAGN